MSKIRVLISDPISEKGREILEKADGFQVDNKPGISESDLEKCIADYDALIVRSQTKVTQAVIGKAKKLKIIGRAGVGVDNVDVDAATKSGIIVMNTPDVNTISTAEHTVTMMLALSRNIPQAVASVKGGKWDRSKFVGTEISGKTLGIVGLGRIGSEVALRAKAFGMRVLAYDPFMSKEKAAQLAIEMADLKKIYKESDFITVHTPLTSETKGLIGKSAIAQMKEGVRLINCARGGIIDEAALEEALKSGKVAGAALDVYEQEPLKDFRLAQLPNVIATPHLGASTEEAQVNVAIDVARAVVDALKNGTIRNAVNMPSLDAEQLKQLQPYLFLGEKLGLLVAQLLEGTVEEVRIVYSGKVAEFHVAPITTASIKGLLGHVLQLSVNFVNAPVLAKERGIKVIEQKTSTTEDFADLLEIEVKTSQRVFSVAGTLFGKKNDPRVVRINGNIVDAVPSGYLLILSNVDRPGIIGALGTMLGQNNINIAGMTVGRKEIGKLAVTVVNVDSVVSKEVLKKIESIPDIVSCKMVEL